MSSTDMANLMEDLWKRLGMSAVPLVGDACTLALGDDVEVEIALEGGVVMLTCDLGPLPAHPDYALALMLLRANAPDGDGQLFRVGADVAGRLVLWAAPALGIIDAEALEMFLDELPGRVRSLRAALAGDEPEIDMSPAPVDAAEVLVRI
ncbi:CesT family type III secretion system chaperone [Alsobacter sp. SYSU M60028]|uniref:CesT family type III secretion system chaperone n=1 Tax=Alsobacter ponti TaxID=2962936 RepID=A0ABT1LDE7_9HYPH|nr:CesT family type III secretion system chaperone [Alsobacter ponti]MCP8939525.1 CesT family type III secretion system chaperone [Alsobacter ponti]